jgi:hypothetical protein
MRCNGTGLVALTLFAHAAHAAPAELALGDAQLQLEPRRSIFDDDATAASLPWARFAGFAQLTGGGRSGGDLGVGAAAAVAGIGCDLVSVTAHARLRPLAEGGEPLGAVTYSLCPIAALFTIQFHGRRATGVVPALDARRSLWNRAYSEVYDRVTISVGPYWKRDGSPFHSTFVMAIGHGTTTQTDRIDTQVTRTIDVDFAMYRYRRPNGLGIDALVLAVDALKVGVDDRGGVASDFAPIRVSWDGPIYAHAQVGWGTTGGQITANTSTTVDGEQVSSWTDTINSDGLPDITQVVGEVEAGIRLDRVAAGARIARSFFPTFDGNVARESRVAGTVTWTAGQSRRTSITLAPFAARTRTWSREAPSTRDLSAGAQLQLSRELTRKLRIDAIGEAGLSPYARGESERLPTGNYGGQLIVALSGRVSPLPR